MGRRSSLRTLRIGLTAVALLTAATVLFYLWASSSTMEPQEWSVVKHNPDLEPAQPARDVISVMTYNIGYLSGNTNNRPVRRPGLGFFQKNLNDFLSVLKEANPDIIAFQEIDFASRRSHFQDQLDLVAEKGGYPHTAAAVNWDKRFVPFPYWPPGVQFGRMVSGQAVASRFPIGGVQRIVLEKPMSKPFFYKALYLDRLIQVVQLAVGGRTLCVLNVHLEAFDLPTKENQARRLLGVYRSLRGRFPVVILGDLNSVPPNASMKHGYIDEPETDFRRDRTMAVVSSEESLAWAFPEGENRGEEKAAFTFPAGAPNRKLDYILYDKERIEMVEARIIRIESSDHLPMLMRFRFRDRPVSGIPRPDRGGRE